MPLNISTQLMLTVSVNTFPCSPNSRQGPNGSHLAASVNNISFVLPSIDILQAYYNHISGVYGDQFPSFPPFLFNFTAEDLPLALETPKRGTVAQKWKFLNITQLWSLFCKERTWLQGQIIRCTYMDIVFTWLRIWEFW